MVKPQNLDDSLAVSYEIWQNFPRETMGPIYYVSELTEYIFPAGVSLNFFCIVLLS